MDTPEPKHGVRQRKKDEARNRIADAVIALMADGSSDINHDAVASIVGIGRRTVYRYFPDRQALLASAAARARALMGRGPFPRNEQDLFDTYSIYTGQDRIASIVTLLRSTPQGRAIRLSQKNERQNSYMAATADIVKDLSEEERVLATAVFQVLHTTPWLDMRDNWDLSGEQIARATGWAIRTLVADLRARGGRSIDE